jgi:hypothetical protein
MNAIRFNRHQLFTENWMEYHTTTLRMVEEFFLDMDETPFNSLTNMLCGVWDGYLYSEMLETAKGMGLPNHIINRIQNTIWFIEENN